MRIKRLTCRACGGPKVTPLRTAYVYCDYCGALTDFDFQIANATAGSARPDPQFEALSLYLRPRLAEALGRGDRHGYGSVQTQLFEAHIRTCPAAYSPRVGDPMYRQGILGYCVASRVVVDFDPALKRLEQDVEKAEQTMRWVEIDTGARWGYGSAPQPSAPCPDTMYRSFARSDRFWNLFNAWNVRIGAIFAAYDRAGVVRTHPDKAPSDLLMRIDASVFVQKWLPSLQPDDAARLLATTRLSGEYVEQEAPKTIEKHCGICSADLPIVQGARCVLCFSCGYLLDVGLPDIVCHHCGYTFSPSGGRTASCPKCRATAQLV